MSQIILSLLLAIRVVESADGLDPAARGNDYQVTPVCVQDVNRIYGTRYIWPNDVRDRETAENIVVLYLTHYGNVYLREYGKMPTRNVLSRIYHRGYRGMKRGEGKSYALKIERVIKNGKQKNRRRP